MTRWWFFCGLAVVSQISLDSILWDDDISTQKEFRSETKRLLDIIVNSLYSEQDVFLRELVSNAVDALEKRRNLNLITTGSAQDSSLRIDINITSDNGLIVTDNGIGMNSSELEVNLGTVAKSGTLQMKDDKSSLIGQFGLGFYSAFLVSDRVTVISRPFGEEDRPTHAWTSKIDGTFAIKQVPNDLFPYECGTSVFLHLKNQELVVRYTKISNLKEILTRFSGFLSSFPIYINDNMDPMAEPLLINSQKPIWLRNKQDLTDTDYQTFYKAITKRGLPPIAHTHFHAEGDDIQFTVISFLLCINERFRASFL